MRGTCRLCFTKTELLESHVIPSFVYKWLKSTSGSGFLRLGMEPNRRAQDGHKRFWLCEVCEARLNYWETKFANTIFHPLNAGNTGTLPYSSWLLKFCVSISWRVLTLLMEDADLNHFPDELKTAAEHAHATWKGFLLDIIPHPGKYEQHFLPLDAVESYTGPALPTNINRYILRSVDIDAACGGPNAFIYSKLGRFIIVGFINMEQRRHWKGTKVPVQDGVIRPQTYTVPRKFGDYLETRARKAAGLQSQISAKQQDKVANSYRKNIERAAESESFKALDHDVRLFGESAFKDES